MAKWRDSVDLAAPCWEDYRPLLMRLPNRGFPAPDQLNRLLPEVCLNGRGQPVRFVPAEEPGPADYEERIYYTGQVSTRAESWHDLFNALVWCRLPRLKAALNAQHHAYRDAAPAGARGPRRDALTLFDESGVIVAGSSLRALRALAARRWSQAFCENARAWERDLRIFLCGHSLLEKFRSPYKAITGHAVFVRLGAGKGAAGRAALRSELDAWLAASLSQDRLLRSPADLSPLPLTGIPGWWPAGAQNAGFYADRSVFRPAPAGLTAATIHHLERGWAAGPLRD